MSDMQKIQFGNEQIERMAKAKGIDLNNLPTKEELDRKALKDAWKSYQRKVQRWYMSMSIWPSDQKMKFTFKNWNVNLQDGDVAKVLGNRAFGLAKAMKDKPLNVLMAGDKGVGKTSLALAMLDVLSNEKSTMFVSTAELANLIGQMYTYDDVTKRLKRIEKAMKEADILLLDDFGTEGGMKISNQAFGPVRKDMQEFMYRVVNARFDLNSNSVIKSTIVTTNNLQVELEQMYNDKLISRLIPRSKEQRLAFNGMKDVRGV